MHLGAVRGFRRAPFACAGFGAQSRLQSARAIASSWILVPTALLPGGRLLLPPKGTPASRCRGNPCAWLLLGAVREAVEDLAGRGAGSPDKRAHARRPSMRKRATLARSCSTPDVSAWRGIAGAARRAQARWDLRAGGAELRPPPKICAWPILTVVMKAQQTCTSRAESSPTILADVNQACRNGQAQAALVATGRTKSIRSMLAAMP